MAKNDVEDKNMANNEEGSKKEKKKGKKRGGIIIAAVVLVVLLVGGGIAAYYIYESIYFFNTENAQITADNITISPLVAGSLAEWNVKEGDTVKANQVLGRLDIQDVAGTSEVNVRQFADAASLALSRAEIKTPIDGKIVRSNVIIGETLAPGMETAIVADTNNMYISANIEETDVLKIEKGQFVDITIDAYPGKKFTGYVERVSQTTQNAFSPFAGLTTSGTFSKTTQLIPVRISIVNNENLPFIIGMNAVVKIHIKS
jgi:multidrug resistance efflux pump